MLGWLQGISTSWSHIRCVRRLLSGRVLIGFDRLAALRLRGGHTARARGFVALMASAITLAIAFAGCGGGGHTQSTAAADINGGVASGTSTTGTSSAGAATSTTGSVTTSTSPSSTTSAQGRGDGGADTGTPAIGGTVKNAPNDSGQAHGGSNASKGVAHGKSKPKTSGKTAPGGGGSTAGSGTGSSTAGDPSSSAPNANTGVPYEVNTTSMEPTFQPETKIYYDPTRTHPQIGEVVVFYLPAGAEESACGQVMVGGRACSTPIPGMTKNKEISFKRVVGLPGDTIAIREGHVIRNGQPEQGEPPTMPCEKDEKLNCEFPTPITVPPNSYYLLADNRGLDKEDSRIFGAVPQEYILGTVEGG
jgi:signal peptidase I